MGTKFYHSRCDTVVACVCDTPRGKDGCSNGLDKNGAQRLVFFMDERRREASEAFRIAIRQGGIRLLPKHLQRYKRADAGAA